MRRAILVLFSLLIPLSGIANAGPADAPTVGAPSQASRAANGQQYWDPDNSCNEASNDASAKSVKRYIDNPPGSDHQHQVWYFYQMKGLSAKQAAGVVGNMMNESGDSI